MAAAEAKAADAARAEEKALKKAAKKGAPIAQHMFTPALTSPTMPNF